MKKDDIYISHILISINAIEDYLKGKSQKDFLLYWNLQIPMRTNFCENLSSNKLLQDGVVRQLEIIGEATKNISKEFRSKHTNIPWKEIAGTRDKLIHDYLGVDLKAVWSTIKIDLPQLKENISLLLQKS
ncbi:DUF86 domain-containing protein [Candidatus Micrarchaeota archaeon]|nr:DUF86 domain-containing protein [Candidatus Micrarchaeota archaeon]